MRDGAVLVSLSPLAVDRPFGWRSETLATCRARKNPGRSGRGKAASLLENGRPQRRSRADSQADECRRRRLRPAKMGR